MENDSVRKAGDLLTAILGNKINTDFAKENAALFSSWPRIVLEAYVGKNEKQSKYLSPEELLEHKQKEINAKKAGDHTRIYDIKNDTLIIEADHTGWIQILQAKQKQILYLIKRDYKNINLRSIVYYLAKEQKETFENIPNVNSNIIEEDKAPLENVDDLYKNIKNTKLLAVLRKMEEELRERG